MGNQDKPKNRPDAKKGGDQRNIPRNDTGRGQNKDILQRERPAAPYNFSPFCRQAIIRYSDMKNLPGHEIQDPSLKSGEIAVRMVAETPIIIAGEKKGNNRYFYRDPDGHFAIPGSTVKGLIRENMQILGFGFVRSEEDVYDEKLFFRDIAEKDKNTNNYYLTALGIKQDNMSAEGKTDIPQKIAIKAGYLVCEREDRYSIYPLPESENNGECYSLPRTKANMVDLPELKKLQLCQRTSEKALERKGYSKEESKKIADEINRTNKERTAKILDVCYKAHDGKILDLKITSQIEPGMKKGKLLIPGMPVNGIESPVYLFPRFSPKMDSIPISNDDLRMYKDDLDARRPTLPKDGQKKTLWDLPENEGEYKPVFYLRDKDNHVYFGMTRFPRIGYPHSVADGLPKAHKANSEKEIESRSIDYPSAIFGFVAGKQAYKSRVTCENLSLTEDKQMMDLPPLILATPKPSYFRAYLKDGTDYTTDFYLRGFKHYWFRMRPEEEGSNKANVAVRLHPLPKGSCFSGSIRFRNLTEDELGLLLWSLLPKEAGDYHHNIGGAKPYGYGRVKLMINKLVEYDMSTLYNADSLCQSGQDCTGKIAGYINTYKKFAENRLKKGGVSQQDKPFESPEIADFLYMKSLITRNSTEVCYMKVKEFSAVRGSLPTVKEYEKTNKLIELKERTAP